MTKKAVIYARYSCEKQTEQSIEGQLRVCNEFAERNGYTVIHNYIDRAVSGKTDKREQFQQMLKDSADCKTITLFSKLPERQPNYTTLI